MICRMGACLKRLPWLCQSLLNRQLNSVFCVELLEASPAFKATSWCPIGEYKEAISLLQHHFTSRSRSDHYYISSTLMMSGLMCFGER